MRLVVVVFSVTVPGVVGVNVVSQEMTPVPTARAVIGGIGVHRQRALVVATNAAQGNLLYRRVVRAATGLDLLAFDV